MAEAPTRRGDEGPTALAGGGGALLGGGLLGLAALVLYSRIWGNAPVVLGLMLAAFGAFGAYGGWILGVTAYSAIRGERPPGPEGGS